MQDIIFTFIATIFILLAAKQIFYWVWLWQLKEYRTDRMQAHFQDIGARNSFLMFAGYSALRQNKMPKFTIKSLLMFFCAFIAGVLLPIILLGMLGNLVSKWKLSFQASGLYFLILALPLVIFLLVLALNFISNIFKRRVIKKAKEKIGKFPNLTVIGITGSYGKSTTKEILAEILSKKLRVIKTPVNVNTPIGIAQLILNELKNDHQIFIAEMGAYKLGEIKEICDIVKPKIGIITAINEQHLALFGSMKNTIKAKFELIDSLPQDGLAIVNIGDKNIQLGIEERKNIKPEVKLYSVGEKSDFYAINVFTSGRYVKFKLISGQEIQDFTLNVIGTHNISNALAAIIVAKKMGIALSEISQTFQRISRLPGIFKISIGPGGSTFIEDTYNANPDGVLAALDYLKNQRGRKIVIMSSLIELGFSAREIHKKLGKEISGIANKLIVMDNYYITDIKAGVRENKDSIIEIGLGKNAQKVAKRLRQDLKPSDMALFINRGAGKVLELLKK